MARSRYFNGHCLKSIAREGESAGLRAGSGAAGAGCAAAVAGGVDTGADIPGRLSGGTDTDGAHGAHP